MAQSPVEMEMLAGSGLVLEPLVAAHAQAMYEVLDDPELYRFVDDGPPASVEALRERYARLESRQSADGLQAWLNWIVRPTNGAAIGFVQATVEEHTAWVAFMFRRESWGQGHATRAC